ncbi:MAG: hypothetical protein J6X18_03895 [Bacteroidales bacterium]|nr:hypothetical protein [Bacteroidales bacterium]
MKKVFLLLASALMGVASFAAEWTYDDAKKEISVDYNMYGTKDAAGTSIQWQAGNQGALLDAVEEATSDVAWVPQQGEKFSVTISGVASNTGKLQMCVVDERPEVGYYAELSGYAAVDVEKDKPFTLEGVLSIKNTVYTNDKTGEEVALTKPGLILGFLYSGVSTDEGFSSTDPFIITNAEMEVAFAVAANYESPVELAYNGKSPADDTKYQYQYEFTSKVDPGKVKAGAYANVTFTGKAISDVTTLMYVLADNSMQKPDETHEGSWYFAQTTADFITFAANIKAGDNVNKQFSYALEKGSNPETDEELVSEDKKGPRFEDVLLAEATEKLMALYFENASITVEITDEPKYGDPDPGTAVEEVSNVAFENGVIYSSSIVVYNQAGQVVATASDEFAINTLKAGIYFAKTAEGSISFVVK